jgi:adenosylmethionine-8-amino-7-oxononanoate aminotransferase
MTEQTRRWLEADAAHCWHPFTDQGAWTAPGGDPLVLVAGQGPWLEDSEGRRYLDGNSSIWTNIHGHNHPKLNAALHAQLGRIAHSSFLGFANPRASELAERLAGFFPAGTLERVFFSDDGSTAVEVAVKMAIQSHQQSGREERTGFIAFDNAYHGDTMGAASLGGVERFHERFRKFGFPVTHVGSMDDLRALPELLTATTAAVVIEPLVQGVNEMHLWPDGMLRELRAWCDASGVQLILDEVMTGFGRTGTMFACQQEDVIPDFLCLAKGLTGGYLPMAATLTTREVYDAFLGGPDKVFYYGHSYTGNQLGAAVALASLDLFEEERVLEGVAAKAAVLRRELAGLKERHPLVHEIRQRGLVAGIELRREDGKRFAPTEAVGPRVCLAARAEGLLTRPIRDTIVLMPPLCTTEDELRGAVSALEKALAAGI